MDVMVQCPCCAGDGCVVCHDTGLVKQANLDRAREHDLWSVEAMAWLWEKAIGPVWDERRRP